MTNEQPSGFIEVTDVLNQLYRLTAQTRSCFSCENINITENICNKFGSQPPLKIIKDACPHYAREIPF